MENTKYFQFLKTKFYVKYSFKVRIVLTKKILRKNIIFLMFK